MKEERKLTKEEVLNGMILDKSLERDRYVPETKSKDRKPENKEKKTGV